MDRVVREDPAAPAAPAAPAEGRSWRDWLDARLNFGAFYRKYGRKVFPVHSSFFLGEMALFAFVILVLTGVYLGLIYVPSTAELTVGDQTYPEAYASVRLIESIPVANLFRNTHHWASHLMVASVLLHLLRVFFTGSYRFPREVNWVVGVVLLGLTLMAGFVGYALPFDSYAVTATGIGFAIARSIPWVGDVASELFFGGAFPTLGSLARLYTIHVFIVPTLLALLIGAHLLIVLKQKHTQPGYARPIAEPGKILGVPLWPYQALLAGELFLLMFGALFVLSAFVPPHPLEAFGPPGPTTPEVKPDWYLMWVYGFLKIVPARATFTLFGATIGPNFIGGLLFPALLFGVLTLTPWIDRTNRRALRRVEYLEPVHQSPARLASGLAVLAFIGTLFVAAYYDEIGLSLGQIWAIVVGVPLLVGVAVWLAAGRTQPAVRFDPHAAYAPARPGAKAGVLPQMPLAPEPAAPPTPVAPPEPAPVAAPPVPAPTPTEPAPAAGMPVPRRAGPLTTPAARGERARDNLVAALHEAGELAPLVRQLDEGPELLEVLSYVDSLRLTLADSNQILQGVVRGDAAAEPFPPPPGDGPAPA